MLEICRHVLSTKLDHLTYRKKNTHLQIQSFFSARKRNNNLSSRIIWCNHWTIDMFRKS